MKADCNIVKEEKIKGKLKVVFIIIAVIFLVIIIRLFLLGSAIALLVLDGRRAEVHEDTDVSHYLWYIGNEAKDEYAHKWGMNESIFPEKISDNMNVIDYKMVYYDPWDAQYLSYLVVEYDDESYKLEGEKLRRYASTEYMGYFGAEGFMEEYTLLAMEADPGFGLIYALAGTHNQIVYVELIFCNYFYDIDYKSMICEEYLPLGFDATVENSYRQQIYSVPHFRIYDIRRGFRGNGEIGIR